MRAIRIECGFDSIQEDPRTQASLSCISWDYRSTLDIRDGNLRLLVECITTGDPIPPPTFSINGVTIIDILETWKTQNLKHHLVVIEFASDFIGRFFESNDLAIVSGTNLTKNGLIIQLVGKQTAIMEFLNAIRGEIKVDRVTTGKGGEGMIERGPSIQQFKVIKTAFENGWYDVPKGISIRDLADKLDLSKSSVAEHLVRAENNIVGNFLENSK
tara:strand:- start:1181 stop:1825 length:645 start_codon:yes stop_codon:yes gene_type:complete